MTQAPILFALLLSSIAQNSVILSGVEHGFIVRNEVEGPRNRPRHLNLPDLFALEFQTPEPSPKTPFAGLIFEYLRRDAAGHSPTPEEIAAMASLRPAPDAASIREAMPLLLRALENPDIPLHTFALTALTGLQVQPPAPPEPPAAPPSNVDPNMLPAPSAPPPPPPPPDPAAYPAEAARAIAPYIPQIATHLNSEDAQSNRLLTATILGGFTPGPPAPVYAPLLAFLKRDDAVGPVGLAVVTDLVQLGPISAETAAAITRFLRRPDQTGDSRANLADLLATSKNQSQAVNKALLLYLGSDDNSLRARVILSLPQLDLDPQDFSRHQIPPRPDSRRPRREPAGRHRSQARRALLDRSEDAQRLPYLLGRAQQSGTSKTKADPSGMTNNWLYRLSFVIPEGSAFARRCTSPATSLPTSFSLPAHAIVHRCPPLLHPGFVLCRDDSQRAVPELMYSDIGICQAEFV